MSADGSQTICKGIWQEAVLERRITALEYALAALESANEELAAQRSVRTYHSIVQDGAEELLTGLDNARRRARDLLTQGV